jgi:hypothetical protein
MNYAFAIICFGLGVALMFGEIYSVVAVLRWLGECLLPVLARTKN